MPRWRVALLLGAAALLGCGSRTGLAIGEQPEAGGAVVADSGDALDVQAETSVCSSYTTLEACAVSGVCESCRCDHCFNGSEDGGPCGPAKVFVCLASADMSRSCWSYCPDGSLGP